MVDSYQHNEVVALMPRSSSNNNNENYGNDDVSLVDTTRGNRRRHTLLAATGLMVLFFAAVSFNRGGGDQAEVAMLRASAPELAATASLPKETPWWQRGEIARKSGPNREGRYDWKKCVGSSDPDCWHEEAKRVESYWGGGGGAVEEPPASSTDSSLSDSSSYDSFSSESSSSESSSSESSSSESSYDNYNDQAEFAMLRASAPESAAEESLLTKTPWWEGENAPKHDHHFEGRYDWKKCVGSSDPDCWDEEEKRVESFWDEHPEKAKQVESQIDKVRDEIENAFDSGDGGEDSSSSDSEEPTALVHWWKGRDRARGWNHGNH